MDGIVIFGPTASGKSALALRLAERLGGEIINADSRQVYRGVQLVAAGPTAAERLHVPHYLFDWLPLTEAYSAGRWAGAAAVVIGDVRGRGRLPIVVGGTGFYLKALLEGLDGVPALAADAYARFAAVPVAELWRQVQELDAPLAARLAGTAEQHNRQRLGRALAVFAETGKRLSAWQDEPGRAPVAGRWLRVGLNPPVAVLGERIAQRWRQLLAAGLLDEVAALREVPVDAPGLQALTVPVWLALLRGEIAEDEAIALASVKDRQYAKRQRTWLRTQYGAAREFAAAEEADEWIKSFSGPK